MAKSVISCGSVDNSVDFTTGDIVKDEQGNLYLVTDEQLIVVIYSKTEEVGTAYDYEECKLVVVPQGLSVTLTQE